MAATPSPSRSDGTVLFLNGAFEAEGGSEGIAAGLQAARLRLEAVESERAALQAELTAVQNRLHDSLEVLEGLLGERSALLKQNRSLQAQLAAALEGQPSPANSPLGTGRSLSADGTPRPSSERRLRQELLLAQAQLRELRQAQDAWVAERAALLSEVEEERQRLQEGLAEALTQASCAQREADAAAERASHWCSLAQVLQRSALLPDAPASPATLASPFGSTPSSSGAKSAAALPRSVTRSAGSRSAAGSRCGSGSNDGSGARPAPALLAEWQSPASAPLRVQADRRPSTADRYAAASVSTSCSQDGPGLIAAFQAVAGPASPAPAAAAEVAQAAAQETPALRCCPSPQLPRAAGSEGTSPAAARSASQPASLLAASSDLAPGTHLQLLKRLAAPGLSYASSMDSPLTPALTAASLGGKGLASPATSCEATPPLPAAPAAGGSTSVQRRAPPRHSFLSRLLCAGGLPPADAAVPRGTAA